MKLSRSRATHFSLLVQRKVGKRKHLPQQINPNTAMLSGFFDSPSLANRKTAGVVPAAPWV
jgi:hypothetical protein